MEAIKISAINRMITQLNNMGCLIKVINEEGDVVIDTLPKEKELRRRKNIEALCGYKAKLRALSPGELTSIEVPDGLTQKDIQSTVTSFMAATFGNGTYVTERSEDGKSVSCLRVE